MLKCKPNYNYSSILPLGLKCRLIYYPNTKNLDWTPHVRALQHDLWSARILPKVHSTLVIRIQPLPNGYTPYSGTAPFLWIQTHLCTILSAKISLPPYTRVSGRSLRWLSMLIVGNIAKNLIQGYCSCTPLLFIIRVNGFHELLVAFWDLEIAEDYNLFRCNSFIIYFLMLFRRPTFF